MCAATYRAIEDENTREAISIYKSFNIDVDNVLDDKIDAAAKTRTNSFLTVAPN